MYVIRSKLVLPAFLGILLVSTLSPAEEVKKQAKATTPPEKFYVYGGGCSRSIRLQGTYDTLPAAFTAAEILRSTDKLNHVTIRTGDHDKDHFGRAATEYKVYRQMWRCSISLHKTVDKWDKANQIADELRKSGGRVEIVGHYAPKQVAREAGK
jgi:hypothetical protein